MLIKPIERLSSQTKVHSPLPNSQSRIIDCVIRSDSPYQGSLYVSGTKGVQNVDNIRYLNVKSILTCSEGSKLSYSLNDIPNYKYLPFPQNSIFSLNQYFRTVSTFINESLTKSNVFFHFIQCIVHFSNGSNHSISVIIAYLMRYQSLNLQKALSYIKKQIKKVIFLFIKIDLDQKQQDSLKQFWNFLQKNNEKAKSSSKLRTSQVSSLNSQSNKQINQSINSKLDQNPQNMDVKFDKFQTAKRYKTSKSHVNDEYIKKQAKSKLKTESPSKIKMQSNHSNDNSRIHKQALHFDQIFSSNHIEYIAIKREAKNSKSCFKKQKNQEVSFSPYQESFKMQETDGKIDYLTVEKDGNKSRFSSSKKSHSQSKYNTQKSQKNSQHKSIKSKENYRQKTKRTEQNADQTPFLKVMNPQHQELSKSRVSQMSRSSNGMRNKSSQRSHKKSNTTDEVDIEQILISKFMFSPSKRGHFEEVNQQLNNCINHITTSYETEMTNLRVNYHNRLRHIRPVMIKNPTQQSKSQSGNQKP